HSSTLFPYTTLFRSDNKPVAQGRAVPDHVQMAVGDGVEGTWVEGNTRHGHVLPRPARAGKPGRFLGHFQPVPSNVLQMSRRPCRRWPVCFVLGAATKQNGARTKPFPTPAKTSG